MAKAATKPAADPGLGAAIHTPRKSNGTVTVACKFPNGIRLQLCRRVEFVEEGLGGQRINRVRFDKVGETYFVRGPVQPNGQVPKGYQRPILSEGGYALTRGIPEAFWNEWLKQNKDSPYVLNKIILAAPTPDRAEDETDDMAEIKTGFEPIVPDSDPRIPRSQNAYVSDVETGNRRD